MGLSLDVDEAAQKDIQLLAGKYLTFKLDAEVYGLPIQTVQEIIGIMQVTRVPRTPPFVRGVINLRGKVIPVVDLRVQFGMQPCHDSSTTCVIVVQVIWGTTKTTIGVIVDEVSEVIDIRAPQIEPPPSFAPSGEEAYILGMGKLGERVVMLLDADRVLSQSDLNSVAQAG